MCRYATPVDYYIIIPIKLLVIILVIPLDKNNTTTTGTVSPCCIFEFGTQRSARRDVPRQRAGHVPAHAALAQARYRDIEYSAGRRGHGQAGLPGGVHRPLATAGRRAEAGACSGAAHRFYVQICGGERSYCDRRAAGGARGRVLPPRAFSSTSADSKPRVCISLLFFAVSQLCIL